jgi:hypothetical protein
VYGLVSGKVFGWAGVAGELVMGYSVQEGSGRNPGLLGGGS